MSERCHVSAEKENIDITDATQTGTLRRLNFK